MKVTLYTTDESCEELIKVRVAHISMFEKNKLKLHFITYEDQMNFIKVCITKYVLLEVQGQNVLVIPESSNFQRVRFRFDND